jgi:hypothetical protein
LLNHISVVGFFNDELMSDRPTIVLAKIAAARRRFPLLGINLYVTLTKEEEDVGDKRSLICTVRTTGASSNSIFTLRGLRATAPLC